jgi:hypothetical protein
MTRSIAELWSKGLETEGWVLYWKTLYGHVADLLDRDEALRRATLVVDFEALCSHAGQVMTRVLKHCELPSDAIDLAAEAARMIRPPSYYRPAFSDEQLGRIQTATAPVKQRLDTFAQRD